MADIHNNIIQRVNAGNTGKADQYRASAELSLSELEVEDAEHEVDTAYKRLAALWGRTQPAFSYLDGDMYTATDIGNFDTIASSIANNRNFLLLNAREKVAAAEKKLYRIDAKNRWTFNTGLRHHAETDDVSIVAGFSIPLGGEKRNRGKLAALDADIATLRSEASSLRIALEAELYALHQTHQHALHVIDVLATNTIPALNRALSETENAYNIGRSSFQDWIIVREELTENRIRLLNAFLSAHLARIEIERLTGSSLNGERPQTSTLPANH